MMSEPAAWHELMSKLATAVGNYLLAQARAGAHALQIFDSWCGELAPADYTTFALPYVRRVIDIIRPAGVPIILFGVNTGSLLDLMANSGADVIGVDWRTCLGTAFDRLGPGVAVQGNLDPIALLADWDTCRERAQAVLDQAGGRPGHIFNLGHGVLPETPVDHVRRLVEFVHTESRR
jgi:uroporphyrinogen decarboxylase